MQCEEHFNGFRHNFALLAARLTKITKEKTIQKCGEKIFRFITELRLPFLSPADNKCHVSFRVMSQKEKYLFIEVQGSLSFQN